jgi:2-isopropylmalate synthase
MRPEDVGVPATTLVLGKHSGRHAVARRCEQLGVTLSRHDLDQVYRRMVTLADTRKHVTDDDLRAIVGDVSGYPPGANAAHEQPSDSAGYGFGV